MKIINTLLILVISQVALAQIPTLSVHRESGEEKLEISQLDVNVEIVGNIATTTFDIVFYNPFNKILEGELSMPLKEGQEICRYALDINGKLREGVIVEKVKARQTFEAVVRRKIDPGIINKTKGNNFKTKIYPIPSKGNKRVVLALTETLKGDDENLYYSLPFENAGKVNQFSLNVKAIKNHLKSKEIHSEFQNVQFDNQDDAYVLRFERENFIATGPLNFTIPRFSKENHQLFTYDFEGKTYFYLNVKPDKLQSIKKVLPKNIAVFWDNSFSASKRNITKELTLLESYLKTLKTDVNVSVTTFNQASSEPKTFKSSQINEIISYLKNLENDGGTSLDDIDFPNNVDEIILFSDGVNTIGKDKITASKPVFTITSNAGSNYSLLKQISAKTNGEFINLNMLSNKRALQLLTSDQEKFLSYKYDNNSIKEIYPKLPTRVDDYFEIAGILTKDNAQLTINFGNKNGITQTKTYPIHKKPSSPTVARIWATKKITDLDFNYAKNKDEIFALSQKNTIITKNTAMLILDRVEDYVTHKIVPPNELKEEYNRILALQKDREPKKTTFDEIEKRNINRIKELGNWYENSIISKKKMTPPPSPNSIEVVEDEEEVLEEMIVLEESEVTENMVSSATSDSNRSNSKPSIKILSWIPDAPYMKELRAVNEAELLPLYYKLKDENRNRPAFYIQVSDLFFSKGRQSEAVRILSNAVELDLENPELLKVVARRLLDEKEYDMAIKIFLEIKDLRPEEPQSYRDLAMAYNANKQYKKALEMYLHILDNEWGRFEAIKDVVFNEFNNLISLQKNNLNLTNVNKDYIKSMPLNIRITIDWSSNENDIDLWVIDPNGEKCFYSHPRTEIGGKITADFTRGYGPEEFSLKIAKRGLYTVYVNYYSESRQTITGPVTVYAELTTYYSTEKQVTERITIQLENNDSKKTMQIGQLEFKE